MRFNSRSDSSIYIGKTVYWSGYWQDGESRLGGQRWWCQSEVRRSDVDIQSSVLYPRVPRSRSSSVSERQCSGQRSE